MICSVFRKLGFVLVAGIPLMSSAGFADDSLVNQRVELGTMKAPDGAPVELKAPPGGTVVLIFYSSECPISNSYSPFLNRLRDEYPEKTVRVVGVCVDPDLSRSDVESHAKEYELKFPVIHDRHAALSAKVGAKVTPEAFVLDDRGRIRYHGRLNDQFAARQKRNANSKTNELRDAIDAILAGKNVEVPYVEAVGCPIPTPTISQSEPPTYATHVASILQKNCLECHRRGQVGPFPLETYEQARKRADDLASVAEDRLMPPWKADPHVGPGFKNDRSLSSEEISTLLAWAEAGAPEGDPSQTPAPPQFHDDWALGTPDLVVEMPDNFPIPASGEDIYRCFVIPTRLPADTYINAIEYRPGNRRVVHHMLGYVDVSGEGRKKDAADAEQGYSCFSGPEVDVHGDLGGWAPGNDPSRLPDGLGRSLPKNADVIIQVHYHPSGKDETDRSRVGLYFSKKPVKQVLHWNAAAKFDLDIPPDQPNFKAEGVWVAPVELEAWGVTPHMHLLGKDMLMSLEFPDGRKQDLVKLNDWDFAWQNAYYFKNPITLPKGTRLRVVAHYDNSSGNPRNPNNPPKRVKWGEATTDEMCIGFIAVTKKGQDLTRPGEKDDLNEIFKAQIEEYKAKAREAQKARQAEKK